MRASSVTWQQVWIVLGVVAAVLAAGVYLESKFNGVTERLATVETEVKGLRRDMGRVEQDIRRIEENIKPTSLGALDW